MHKSVGLPVWIAVEVDRWSFIYHQVMVDDNWRKLGKVVVRRRVLQWSGLLSWQFLEQEDVVPE